MPSVPASPYEDGSPLPQRILLVENSRTFTTLLREAIEQRVELPVTIVSTLAEAARVLDEEEGWFLVLTGLVLVDGDRDQVVEFFTARGLPTVVVSGVYDEDLRRRVLQQQIIDYVVKNAPGSIDYLAWLVQRLERNRRISALVVDDSLSARAYASALLQMYGYRVVAAADGMAGLQAIEQDPSIRLAIVDQEMPGMEGVEFTRRLRGLRSRDKVAVIGISGNTGLADSALPQERRQRLPAQTVLARRILLPGLAERRPARTDRHPAGPGHPRLPHRPAQPPAFPRTKPTQPAAPAGRAPERHRGDGGHRPLQAHQRHLGARGRR